MHCTAVQGFFKTLLSSSSLLSKTNLAQVLVAISTHVFSSFCGIVAQHFHSFFAIVAWRLCSFWGIRNSWSVGWSAFAAGAPDYHNNPVTLHSGTDPTIIYMVKRKIVTTKLLYKYV